MKNKIFISLILILTLLTSIVYADDELTDEIFSQIELKENIQTSIEISDAPTINSRHSVIYDRASGTILYGKSENEQCKMASTTK